MKLLFVLPEFGLYVAGGIATFYRCLLPELTARGHVVHVVLADEGRCPTPAEPPKGVTVQRVDCAQAAPWLARLETLRLVPELRRRLALAYAAWEVARRGEGFDVVETTDWGMLFAPWTAHADRPPLVVQLHSSHGQMGHYDAIEGTELQNALTQLLELSLLPRADELQTPGAPNAREWGQLLGREVIPILPAWQALPEPCRPAANQPVAGLVVGRVQCWKGPAVLCEALRLLGQAAPTIRWAGADTYYRRSGHSMRAHLATSYPNVWGRQVIPLGPRLPAEVAALQAATSFLVVPSIWDVFNLSAVEGMAAGRVVVCSEGAGAAELLRDGTNGFRCPANDPAALADRLRQAQELSDEDRRRMGEAARATVLEQLDPARVVAPRIARFEQLSAGNVPRRVDHPWLTGLVGLAERPFDPLAVLDNLPLKTLTERVFRRAWGRVVGTRHDNGSTTRKARAAVGL